MDDYDNGFYDGNVIDDMWTDYSYHINTGELQDWFPDDDPDNNSNPKPKRNRRR